MARRRNAGVAGGGTLRGSSSNLYGIAYRGGHVRFLPAQPVIARNERLLTAVPGLVYAAFAMTLILQIAWQVLQPPPIARAQALDPPPPLSVLRVASLGDQVPFAQCITLYLQAFDNQPGISIPFRELDYGRVIEWLEAILTLDPIGQYPLLMAAHLYGQVPDPSRQRVMFAFIEKQFLADPNRRWRWLANAALATKHRLKDLPLALRYARAITQLAPAAPPWARQMHLILLEDMGEVESAKVLIGGLLDSGAIQDKFELRFLIDRLESLEKKAEKSSSATK
jgi:hypothetical protein